VSTAEEVAESLRHVDIPFNRFGVDPFGISRRHLRFAFSFLGFFYRHYFRVRLHDLDNIPKRGRARCSVEAPQGAGLRIGAEGGQGNRI